MIRFLFLLLPFGFLSTGLFTLGQSITFILAVLMILSIGMVRERAIKLFGAYVVIWGVCINIASMADATLAKEAAKAMHSIIWMIFAFCIYIAVAQSKASNKSYFNIICISAIIQAVIGVLQIFNIDLVLMVISQLIEAEKPCQIGRAIGSLGNSNFYGGYIAISLPFFFRDGWKKFIPLLVFTLIPLDSNAASSCAVVSAIVGAIVYYRIWWLSMIVAVGGVGFLIFDYDSIINGPRWEWWGMAWNKITASAGNFIFGLGPGASTNLKHPIHNEWLEGMFHYGAVGIVLLIAAVARLTEKRDPVLVAALMAACVNCLGNYPMHLAPSGFLVLIILGLLEREKHGRLSNV